VSGVKSVSVVTMEVPCCQGSHDRPEGLGALKKKIPLEQIIISTRGEVLKIKNWWLKEKFVGAFMNCPCDNAGKKVTIRRG